MNEEMLAKLQKARTVEEIIAIAKEYGKEVTAEKAQELLDKISGATGELSDDALAAVAGGGLDRRHQGMVRKPFWQVKCQSMKRGVSGLFTSRFLLQKYLRTCPMPSVIPKAGCLLSQIYGCGGSKPVFHI